MRCPRCVRQERIVKPYYDDDGCTIYHGDCREILPKLAFDCILTDPPYGLGWNPDNRRFTSKGGDWWREHADDRPFDPSHLLDWPCVLWGANHYASRLPDSAGWLVWDKRAGLEGMGDKWPMSEAELAWTHVQGRGSTCRMRWSGMIRPIEEKPRWHPTQKPVGLMRWCLERLDGVACDPYMGSGTTLRAAKDLGRKAIGIEIEERYCEIAAKRLAQEVLPFAECSPSS